MFHEILLSADSACGLASGNWLDIGEIIASRSRTTVLLEVRIVLDHEAFLLACDGLVPTLCQQVHDSFPILIFVAVGLRFVPRESFLSAKSASQSWHTKGAVTIGACEKVRSSSPRISAPGTYVRKPAGVASAAEIPS